MAKKNFNKKLTVLPNNQKHCIFFMKSGISFIIARKIFAGTWQHVISCALAQCAMASPLLLHNCALCNAAALAQSSCFCTLCTKAWRNAISIAHCAITYAHAVMRMRSATTMILPQRRTPHSDGAGQHRGQPAG